MKRKPDRIENSEILTNLNTISHSPRFRKSIDFLEATDCASTFDLRIQSLTKFGSTCVIASSLSSSM